jgi:hypothetical protein
MVTGVPELASELIAYKINFLWFPRARDRAPRFFSFISKVISLATALISMLSE